MRKYCFLTDGIPISVYPMSSIPGDREPILRELTCGGVAVVICPTVDADFSAVLFDKNNIEPIEPRLCLAALSCFFDVVRGVAKVSFDIIYREKIYELLVGSYQDKNEENAGKCNAVFTKCAKFGDGVEISSYVCKINKHIAVAVCRDSEFFDPSRLTLLSDMMGTMSYALAVSLSDDGEMIVRSVGDLSVAEATTAALLALSEEGRSYDNVKIRATFNGEPLKIHTVDGRLRYCAM